MDKLQARIIVLEAALTQAVHTIEFLDQCLMSPSEGEKERINRIRGGNCSYGYPKQTQRYLKYFDKLVDVRRGGCCHSYYAPGRGEPCKSCEEAHEDRMKLSEAMKVLKLKY